MKTIHFLLAAICFSPLGILEAGGDAERKPNIIFVLFDDFGYGQPPSYRADSEFRMPNLDRLAREGMRFTDAHSAAANWPMRDG
jgi:arylsulfatase A